MHLRPLGCPGIQVAPITSGGNVFGWTADGTTSFRLLDTFVDAGFNLIDTADVYSSWAPGNKGGESETIIGSWLAKSGKRERVVSATKVGRDMQEGGKGLSLARLKTDRIDLCLSHVEDPDVPHEETLATFAELGPLCREEGVGVIPFFALAAGFLTGKYKSEADPAQSARGQRAKAYLDDRGLRIVAALEEVAAGLVLDAAAMDTLARASA